MLILPTSGADSLTCSPYYRGRPSDYLIPLGLHSPTHDFASICIFCFLAVLGDTIRLFQDLTSTLNVQQWIVLVGVSPTPLIIILVPPGTSPWLFAVSVCCLPLSSIPCHRRIQLNVQNAQQLLKSYRIPQGDILDFIDESSILWISVRLSIHSTISIDPHFRLLVNACFPVDLSENQCISLTGMGSGWLSLNAAPIGPRDEASSSSFCNLSFDFRGE